MVRPCEESDRGAHYKKASRYMHLLLFMEKNNCESEAKPKVERCEEERYDRGGLKEENATNRAAWSRPKKIISYRPIGDPI